MYLSYRTLGQDATPPATPDAAPSPTPALPAPDANISPYVAHPYQTGAGFIFGTLISIGWVLFCKMGIKRLRRLKAETHSSKKRRAR